MTVISVRRRLICLGLMPNQTAHPGAMIGKGAAGEAARRF